MTQVVASAGNLFDYFNAKVERARSARSVPLSDDTALYLAALLADRARSDTATLEGETLAELFGRAANAPPAEQVRTFRELGDRSLYRLGYFAESLEGRVVGASYYADMGAAAYYKVHLAVQRWFASAFGIVFEELASEFHSCVGVLGMIRDAERSESDDLMVLYEEWLASGDESIASRLRERGLLLGDGGFSMA